MLVCMIRHLSNRMLPLAALALFSFAAPLWAQSISGTLVGTVTDPSGTVVPNANVVVTNENTGDQNYDPD